MMYYEFETNGQTYNLRLTMKGIMELEKKIGKNPMMIFVSSEGGYRIPTITEMVAILHASLQDAQHGITIQDATNIFTKYLEDGHTPTDFCPVIVEVYQLAGLMSKDAEQKN